MKLTHSRQFGTRRLVSTVFTTVLLGGPLLGNEAQAGVILASYESPATATSDFAATTDNDSELSGIAASRSGRDKTEDAGESQVRELLPLFFKGGVSRLRGGASTPPGPSIGSSFPVVMCLTASLPAQAATISFRNCREARVQLVQPESLPLLDPPRACGT